MSTPAQRKLRIAAVVAVLLSVLLLGLTSCPSNRDGMPGRLAAAKEEAQSAARSAALSLQLWSDRRATRALASVQLSDARDDVVKAYQGVATLRAEDRVDRGRQAFLIGWMTTLVGDLNAAVDAVQALPGHPDPAPLRRRLLDGAAALEAGYR